MTSFEPALLRIEQRARDDTMRIGLRMAVADPCWFLARQIQFGELNAHDAGSPVSAVIEREAATLTAYLPTVSDGTGGAVSIDLTTKPLDAVVEHSATDTGNPITAGMRALTYRRLLTDAAAGADPSTRSVIADYLTELPAAYPLDVPDVDDPVAIALASGWAVDGAQLALELQRVVNGAETLRPPVAAAAARALIVSAAGRFLDVLALEVDTAGNAPADAWYAPRSEYRFTLAAPTPAEAVVLRAPQADSGRLDWYSLDAAQSFPVSPQPTSVVTSTFLPTAVTFPGMPASRLWTVESDPAGFSGLSAAPEDAAAMLVVEFALSYSDEFYLLPLEVPVGSVWRVNSLQVLDSFGRKTPVGSANGVRMFEHTGAGPSPWVAVLPVAADSRTSEPLEVVDLLRDELANLCWAVERTVSDSVGRPADAASLSAIAAGDDPTPAPAPVGQPRTYRMRTPVPANWYPLRPADDRTLHLLHLDGQGNPTARLLTELADVAVPDEEVTRAGKRLVRALRYARASDGSQVLWSTRSIAVAPTTAMPSIRFDTA
jgi:hypothetical protein